MHYSLLSVPGGDRAVPVQVVEGREREEEQPGEAERLWNFRWGRGRRLEDGRSVWPCACSQVISSGSRLRHPWLTTMSLSVE